MNSAKNYTFCCFRVFSKWRIKNEKYKTSMLYVLCTTMFAVIYFKITKKVSFMFLIQLLNLDIRSTGIFKGSAIMFWRVLYVTNSKQSNFQKSQILCYVTRILSALITWNLKFQHYSFSKHLHCNRKCIENSN